MNKMIWYIFIYKAFDCFTCKQFFKVFICIICFSEETVDEILWSFWSVDPVTFRTSEITVWPVKNWTHIQKNIPRAVHFFTSEDVTVIPFGNSIISVWQTGIFKKFFYVIIGKSNRWCEIRWKNCIRYDIIHTCISTVFHSIKASGKNNALDVLICLAHITEHMFDHITDFVILRTVKRLCHRYIIFINYNKYFTIIISSQHLTKETERLLGIRLFGFAIPEVIKQSFTCFTYICIVFFY